MKKLIPALLLVSLLFAAALPVSANLGAGAAACAAGCELVKSGLRGRKLDFSDTDFKTALGVPDFSTVTIVKAPLSTDGVLTLGGRTVYDGQVIRRRNVSSLSFLPASTETTEATFSFRVDDLCAGAEILCRIRLLEGVNYAPEFDTGALESVFSTQRGVTLYGTLPVTDPEGDALEFRVIDPPRHGTITLSEDGKGAFRYTPEEGFVGNDRFRFVARDEYGNFTGIGTKTLTVTERVSEVEYVDMKDAPEYNAALEMTALGIMGGKVVGDDLYFLPDETVSRAEFVAMAMKAVGLRADTTLASTYFDDDGEIPPSLVGYAATAQKCGIVNGEFKDGKLIFRPCDAITKSEAACVMANLSALSGSADLSVFAEEMPGVPVYERAGVAAMRAKGVFLPTDALGNGEALTRRAAAEYLYRLTRL